MLDYPRRGEVWFVGLNPVNGHERGGDRPALIISVDKVNAGPSNLCTIVPITTKWKGIPGHVEIIPPEGGLDRKSYAMCEQIRTISRNRLKNRFGCISNTTLGNIERFIRIFLGL